MTTALYRPPGGSLARRDDGKLMRFDPEDPDDQAAFEACCCSSPCWKLTPCGSSGLAQCSPWDQEIVRYDLDWSNLSLGPGEGSNGWTLVSLTPQPTSVAAAGGTGRCSYSSTTSGPTMTMVVYRWDVNGDPMDFYCDVDENFDPIEPPYHHTHTTNVRLDLFIWFNGSDPVVECRLQADDLVGGAATQLAVKQYSAAFWSAQAVSPSVFPDSQDTDIFDYSGWARIPIATGAGSGYLSVQAVAGSTYPCAGGNPVYVTNEEFGDYEGQTIQLTEIVNGVSVSVLYTVSSYSGAFCGSAVTLDMEQQEWPPDTFEDCDEACEE